MKKNFLQNIMILAGVVLACEAGIMDCTHVLAAGECSATVRAFATEELFQAEERNLTAKEPSLTEEKYVKAGSSSAVHSLADGKYAVDVALTGGSGKASVESPTLMVAEDGKYSAQITWSSPNYDYMVVDGETYDNQNTEGGNSTFLIPILAFDEEMPVIADTVAMGEPHEIAYTLHFYSDSVGSESSLPREGAKRVLLMAAFIIIAGGILNYVTNRKRRRDYLGAGR